MAIGLATIIPTGTVTIRLGHFSRYYHSLSVKYFVSKGEKMTFITIAG